MPTDVFTSGEAKWLGVQVHGLLEQPRVRSISTDRLTLRGFEVATVLTRLNLPKVLDADDAVLAPDAEAAQPLYARYWLHNRGPAPMGGLPAVAHLHPQSIAAEPNSQVVLRLTAASDCTDAAVHGKVRLVCPDGWTASPAELSFVLPPGEYLETDVELVMPPNTPAGLYPVRAELTLTGTSLPASWRQMVEDVCMVSVGASSELAVLRLTGGPEDIDVTPGWAPETNLTPLKVDREIGSHVLVSETGPVRAIPSAKAGLSGK